MDQNPLQQRAARGAGQEQNEQTDLGPYEAAVHATLEHFQDAGQHLWQKDAAWWSSDPAVQQKIAARLGWLDVVDHMIGEADDLRAFAQEVARAGFQKVLLMGMGGSSLAPDLFTMAFKTADGFPELYVLDNTDPAVIALCRDSLNPKTTLYVVSSKSGTTTEPAAFMSYFYDQVQRAKGAGAGENFVAITDAGSPLVAAAQERGFRRIFQNPPDIGGRYSALSYFGLVPAALMGVDVRKLLERAHLMAERCGPGVPAPENPGVWLGAALATLARQGRDKVTFLTTGGTDSFADWAEQLLAESTGKGGTGLVPVAREPVDRPAVYDDDRVFVYMQLASDDIEDLDDAVDALLDAGQPVITFPLDDEYDLGGEFVRWEVAVAVAGKVLGINPFDEPNVTESKNNTKRLLDGYATTHRLPEEPPTAAEGAVQLFAYGAAGASGNGHHKGAGEDSPLAGYLAHLFRQVHPHDYVAILAFLETSDENMDALDDIRCAIRETLKVATTLGFGPRFLHSTGQLHKGGPNSGVFLIFTSDEAEDVKIPGAAYSFNTLIRAQALGDIEALVSKGRRVLRLHLRNVAEGLEEAANLVDETLPTGVMVSG